MSAGPMNRRFYLQPASTSVTRQSGGVRASTYSSTGQVWAEAMDFNTAEDFEGGSQHGTVAATFRMRYRDDVGSDHRLVNADSTGEVWDVIGAFDPTGKRKELRVRAVKRGA